MKKRILCVRCGEEMRQSTLLHYFLNTYNFETVVCQNVPIDECPNCGEIYFSSEVAELFESIRKESIRPSEKVKLEIPSYTFS